MKYFGKAGVMRSDEDIGIGIGEGKFGLGKGGQGWLCEQEEAR
jgi:hypothetical protein